MRISPRLTCSEICAKKLSAQKNFHWSKIDESILLDIAESLPLSKLVGVYNNLATKHNRPRRSRNSISKHCGKLGLSITPVYGTFTTKRIASALKIKQERIYSWIDRGLKTTRTSRRLGAHYFIESRDLRAYARKRPQDFAGVDFDELFMLIEDRCLVDQIKASYPKLENHLKAQRIWCSTTNQIFKSQGEASKALNVSRASIYESIKTGKSTCNFCFERIN